MHAARIEVDEKCANAAAATVMVISFECAHREPDARPDDDDLERK